MKIYIISLLFDNLRVMKKLYTLSEAQKLGTKIIENQSKELKKELLEAKNKASNFNSKEKLTYV